MPTPPRKGPASIAPGQVQRPDNEIVWVACRGGKTCDGKQAKVLLRKNEGMGGTWIQYQCLKCKRPFSVRF